MTTVGVAIAVPPPYGDELDARRRGFGDPAAALMKAHITVLPPTRIQDLPGVVRHLEAVAGRHAGFRVRLRGTGTFRPASPVTYVRVVEGTEQLSTLQQDVRSGPLQRRLEFPFHPHVTVAHRLPEQVLAEAERELADYDASFDVGEITLFELGSGGMWTTLCGFGLPAG